MRFILAFLLLASTAHATLIDKIVAVVNSDVILASDLERFEKTLPLRKELDPLFGFSAEMESGKPNRQQIIDFLIQERLIAQSFKVTDSDVEQEVLSVQRNNKLSREDLIDFLKQKNFVYDDYYELMRTGLQKRALLDHEIRNRVNISDDDVRNYYFNTVAKSSKVPLEYNISLIVMNYKTYRNALVAEKTAQDALQAIHEGELFSEVAKRLSDDPSSQNGGELGFVSEDQMNEALKNPVKRLQIGQVSGLIKTANAIMIMKLLDIKSSESTKLLELKENLRETLAKDEYKKQLYLWAERSKNDAYIRVNE